MECKKICNVYATFPRLWRPPATRGSGQEEYVKLYCCRPLGSDKILSLGNGELSMVPSGRRKKPTGCRGCNPCPGHGYGVVGRFPCNCRFCEECIEEMKCSHGVPHGVFSWANGTDKGWCRVCYESGERSYKGWPYSEHHVSLNLKMEADEKLRLEKKVARKAEREAQQERASKKAALQGTSDAVTGSASSSSGH